MLSNPLQEAADRLGRVLRDAPVLVAYREATASLEADTAATRLLVDLREQQGELARVQQAGLLPSQAQVERLRATQEAVRGSPTIMTSLQATNDARAFLPTVGSLISEALGAEYGALVAPVGC